jgi:hypothetical protein
MSMNGAHPASYLAGTWVLYGGKSRRDVKFIHLRLVPRLRMSTAIPLFPLYAVMAWTGTTAAFENLVLFYEGNKTQKTSSIAIETQRMRADINN